MPITNLLCMMTTRKIKLSPEWYFAPGKRKCRKHRKRHGKIGFLELSSMISSQWKKLGETMMMSLLLRVTVTIILLAATRDKD